MPGTLREIYIDASVLSPAEFSEFYDAVDHHAFFCSYDLKRPRCFTAYWPSSAGSIGEVVSLPAGVVVSSLR